MYNKLNGPLSAQEIERRRLGYLKEILEEYIAYIDTCVFMLDEEYERFFDRLCRIASFIMKEKQLSEPLLATTMLVFQELDSLSKGFSLNGKPCSEQAMDSAKRGLARLARLNAAGVLRFREDEGVEARHADRAMGAVAVSAGDKKVVFITQDNALTIDLLRLNDNQSFSVKNIVCKVDRFGFIKKRDLAEPALAARIRAAESGEGQPQSRPSVGSHEGIKPRGKGSIARFFSTPGEGRGLIDEENRTLGNFEDIGPGDHLTTATGEELVLGAELDSGSEAAIFAVQGRDDIVVKIHRRPDTWKQLRTQQLCSRAFDIEGCIFPEEPVNLGAAFVGHTMKKLPATVSLEALFGGRVRYAADWTRSDYARAALRLAKLFMALDYKGVMMADISGTNIRIAARPDGTADPNGMIYIIDLDSCQLGYGGKIIPPSGVSPSYMAPEYQQEVRELGGWPETRLMSAEGLTFGESCILARLVMCGLHPFKSKSEEPIAPEALIEAGRFPYGSAETRRSAESAGLGAFLWSNMPAGLKQAFHTALTGKPEERTWLRKLTGHLEHYTVWIVDPENLRRFPEINKPLPCALKPCIKVCTDCGREFDLSIEGVLGADAEGREIAVCADCAGKPVAGAVCTDCGRPTLWRGDQVMGKRAHSQCRECFQKGRDSFARYATCLCGRSFPVKMSEDRMAAAGRLRCPVCRQQASSTAVKRPVTAPAVPAAAKAPAAAPATAAPAPARVAAPAPAGVTAPAAPVSVSVRTAPRPPRAADTIGARPDTPGKKQEQPNSFRSFFQKFVGI